MRLRLSLLVLGAALVGDRAAADHAVDDYRNFRALSIELEGRPPTRDELAAFEQPGFDLSAWLDQHLTGPRYAERLRRIYLDALRLELGPQFEYSPPPLVLRRVPVLAPDGTKTYVYFRRGQRRDRAATDGDFCLTPDETGYVFPPSADPRGTGHPVTAAVWAERTVAVKPWWLAMDGLAEGLLLDADGTTATTQVRVCKEEAQVAPTGHILVTGRQTQQDTEPPPQRQTRLPRDTAFAMQNKGRDVSCLTLSGFQLSHECGCGAGLERCMPGAGPGGDPPAFRSGIKTPLGAGVAFESQLLSTSAWWHKWWADEAAHFLDDILGGDRDVRELLTSRATLVNGPLAQFYRSMASVTCCGNPAFGDLTPEPLVVPEAMPADLHPQDTSTWVRIPDRGPRASGLITMPIFLTKYGSRRARAHALYNAFTCKDFTADTVKLAPSEEADLTKRPGCSTCHQTLEPMAAFFTRIVESDWTYLPREHFPVSLPRCDKATKEPGFCKLAYDPAFGLLRGAYASEANVERGAGGLAADVAASPDFAPCVVRTVAESFLGRALGVDDDAWKGELTRTFVAGGYRMKPLVRAILTSPVYLAPRR